PDPRRPGAVRVRAGEVTWTVAAADATALGVARGAAVDDALRTALERAADAEAALRTALRAIARRGFARADLGRRLVRKGHPSTAVEVALERCAGLGLLDDAAFARQFVETRAARGRGPARLRRDLSAMGVARELVDAALAATAGDGETAAGQALALAERRIGQLQGLPKLAQRRRLAAYLARRGFTGEAARKAIGQVVG
ncbi:MAG TPA: RecX family transcriptional regulator, partial [Gemmatimonadales bacterium]|nr:RecX family transcriptional regulator [Gemmatimonadales bacterium]